MRTVVTLSAVALSAWKTLPARESIRYALRLGNVLQWVRHGDESFLQSYNPVLIAHGKRHIPDLEAVEFLDQCIHAFHGV